jgi:DNA-binding transcriptional LysR family regulator
VTAAPAFDPATSDRIFRIYVSDYTLITIVPHFLQMIGRTAYSVRFDFMSQTSQPHRTLEQGEADILIIPHDFASREHPSEILYEEHFVCIADKNHPRIGRILTRDDFSRERHVVVKPATTATSFEAFAITQQDIERTIDVTTYSFASLPHLVAGTDRIATIHARLAEEAADHLPLNLFDLPFVMPPMRQAIQWHTYRTNDPALIWLRQTLASACRQIGLAIPA